MALLDTWRIEQEPFPPNVSLRSAPSLLAMLPQSRTSECVVELLLYFKLGLADNVRPWVALVGIERKIVRSNHTRNEMSSTYAMQGETARTYIRSRFRMAAFWCSISPRQDSPSFNLGGGGGGNKRAVAA
jgi:hypothetical protein